MGFGCVLFYGTHTSESIRKKTYRRMGLLFVEVGRREHEKICSFKSRSFLSLESESLARGHRMTTHTNLAE